MSLLVLDDQIDVIKVLPGLRRWSTVRLQQLRPGEHILDDRVPEILSSCQEPTFVTIDSDFWTPKLCHSRYCIIYVEIDFRRQEVIPVLLTRMLRDARFRSNAQRMGKVFRVRPIGVSFWEVGNATIQHALFGPTPRKRFRDLGK